MLAKRFSILLTSTFAVLIALATFLGSMQAQTDPAANNVSNRSTVIASGLFNPRGLAFGPDQNLYVANNGISADEGQVVRIALLSSTVVIPASKDNTLYESDTGTLSNGAGERFFAGVTEAGSGNLIRRGTLAFDVNSVIPGGATIVSAVLELNMSRSVSADKQVSLHKLEKDWGEGASNATGEEGAGALAQSGDATWLHALFDTTIWSTAGGDFESLVSASTVVGGIGRYSWSSEQMTSDVQAWVDGSESNFGWLLMGDESGGASAKRFDSRENPEMANRPKLIVQYIAPLPEKAVFMPVVRAAE